MHINKILDAKGFLLQVGTNNLSVNSFLIIPISSNKDNGETVS